MAISDPFIIASTFAADANPEQLVVLGDDVAVNETLWVIAGDDGSGTTLTVTDDVGNTYTPIFATPLALADNYLCRVFECSLDAPLVSGATIRVTRSGPNATSVWDKFVEVAKIVSDGPLLIDQMQRATGTGTAWNSGATPGLSASAGLALAVAVCGGAATSSAPAAGWTEITDDGTSFVDWTMTFQHLNTAGSVTASGVWSFSDNWGALVFAVREAGPTYTPTGSAVGQGTVGQGTVGDHTLGGDTTAPVANVTVQSVSKISRVAGKDSANVTFTADEAFVEYQVRIVPSASSDMSQGALIEQAVVSSTTSHTATITDDELIAAAAVEGSNLLKIFVRDAAGNWST